MDEEIKGILEKGHRPYAKIVFGDNPKKLVENVIAIIKKHKVGEYKITAKP